MIISIELNDGEEAIARDYPKKHKVTLSKAIKDAFIRRLEDEADAKAAKQAYQAYLKSGKVSYSASEVDARYFH